MLPLKPFEVTSTLTAYVLLIAAATRYNKSGNPNVEASRSPSKNLVISLYPLQHVAKSKSEPRCGIVLIV